jgi:mRNA interferase RelE/StbE
MPDEELKLPKWQIVFSSKAEKAGKKLGRGAKTRITEFLEDRVAKSSNPRDLGAALAGEWAGHWRYRVGDYRIICKIEDEIITILVIEIGHRREIYR